MLSVWRCKFESVEKCESGWSKVQYVCDTIMLPICLYSTIVLNRTNASVVWNKDETIVIMQ